MNIHGIELEPDEYYEPEKAARALGWKTATLAANRCRPGGSPR